MENASQVVVSDTLQRQAILLTFGFFCDLSVTFLLPFIAHLVTLASVLMTLAYLPFVIFWYPFGHLGDPFDDFYICF